MKNNQRRLRVARLILALVVLAGIASAATITLRTLDGGGAPRATTATRRLTGSITAYGTSPGSGIVSTATRRIAVGYVPSVATLGPPRTMADPAWMAIQP